MADDKTPEQPANDEPAKKPYHDYHQQEAEELERVLNFLKDVDEPVSIAAGADWRLALRKASYAFRKQKLLDSLPQAYEAYCQRRSGALASPPPARTGSRTAPPLVQQGHSERP